MLRAPADALRSQALLDFELPLAPPRVLTLPSPLPDAEALDVWAPAGRFLLIVGSTGPLTLAFESTLFDLLHEARYPAPAPRRARGGALIAKLKGPSGAAAASCYPRPPGEPILVSAATPPRLLEVGRLLARLHQLGEAHPASVHDPLGGPQLLSRLREGTETEALAPALAWSVDGLPTGATHGLLGPRQVLFVGERASGVLPCGRACSMPLVLDLAMTLVAWSASLEEPLPAIRAVVSGYQALRRLVKEERESLYECLRLAAAREGALRVLEGDEDNTLGPLRAMAALGPSAVLAAAG